MDPAPEAGDAESGERGGAASEEALDGVLVAALGESRELVADVFHERSSRVEGGARVDARGRVARPWRRRDEEGVAVRRLEGERVGFGHVGGPPGEAARELARALAAHRRGASPGGESQPVEAAAEEVPTEDEGKDADALLDALCEAAREATAQRAERGEPVVIDLVVSAERRATHVASSEWGHARDRRTWTRVTVDALTAAGGSARRARGHATLPRGDEAAALAAALVAEAIEAASRRDAVVAPPEGALDIVVAPGAGAVLVHEVVGHALEADEAERGASPLAGLRGERVSCEALSVVDDPGETGLAGSHRVDDEGVEPRSVTLLDRGVVSGLVLDATAGGFDLARTTGHGRRSSYREPPLPRLSNTRVLPGDDDPDDLVRSLGRGLLVERLGRAAADPLRGLVELRVVEGWLVERGRCVAPVAGCVLIGLALDVLASVEGVGRDFAWDDGCGLCGREGQWVGVAVGQPSLRLRAGALGVA